jgi:hypothetical protein
MQSRSELPNDPIRQRADAEGTHGFVHDIAMLSQCDRELAAEFAQFTSVRDVVNWMLRRAMPLESLDVVAQDEFSHDAVVPLGDDGRYISFGMS